MSSARSLNPLSPSEHAAWLSSSIIPTLAQLREGARHNADMATFNPGSDLPSDCHPTEGLPSEIILKIMRQLPDHKSVMNFTKASPKAFRVYKAHPGAILKELLCRDLGSLLPIAVARLEASEAEWAPKKPLQITEPCVDYGTKLTGFCHQYLADHATKLCVHDPYFTFERASELWSFHSTVMAWVNTYGWVIMHETSSMGHMHTPYHRRLDQVESYRFQKILYVTELASILLPIRYGQVQPEDRDKLSEDFWQHFAPWEFCQYSEIQIEFQKFCRKVFVDSKYSDMVTQLRQIPEHLRSSASYDLGHITKVLAFHAGLDALNETRTAKKRFELYRMWPKLLRITENIIEQPEILRRDRGRYFQHMSLNWRQHVAAKYKNLWLDKMDNEDGSTVYSINLDRLTEKFKDLDDAPLGAWLEDILQYTDPDAIFDMQVRDRPYHFPFSSFWSGRRWESENVKLRPPISSVKLAAKANVLTEDNQVIPRPQNP
ncbi:hypothetical protein M434DRAFT_389017 [Hypoxylon sp. CO27-5]|nr:hypothetical protein M434DRAFT_389017 [Hypoxylon sp. CO27-5]